MQNAPVKTGAFLLHRQGLAGAAVANLVIAIAAAAQKQDNPNPVIICDAANAAIAIVIAAAAQKQDNPDDTIFVATTKSTHNKIPP